MRTIRSFIYTLKPYERGIQEILGRYSGFVMPGLGVQIPIVSVVRVRDIREHTMDIFARHGIQNVAYWTPTEGPTANTTLVYLLRHASREAATKSWEAFRSDPQWKEVAKASREAHGKILAKPPESIYLTLTDYSPKAIKLNEQNLHELRIYTAAEGKLRALHNRFRQHTDKLFNKHGIRSVAYFRPLDPPKSTNQMIYVLEHEDRESADQAWQAFLQDPTWRAAKQASETEGRLTAKRPERVYMRLTPYSPAGQTERE